MAKDKPRREPKKPKKAKKKAAGPTAGTAGTPPVFGQSPPAPKPK
jgi:hypothetical protein